MGFAPIIRALKSDEPNKQFRYNQKKSGIRRLKLVTTSFVVIIFSV